MCRASRALRLLAWDGSGRLHLGAPSAHGASTVLATYHVPDDFQHIRAAASTTAWRAVLRRVDELVHLLHILLETQAESIVIDMCHGYSAPQAWTLPTILTSEEVQ